MVELVLHCMLAADVAVIIAYMYFRCVPTATAVNLLLAP